VPEVLGDVVVTVPVALGEPCVTEPLPCVAEGVPCVAVVVPVPVCADGVPAPEEVVCAEAIDTAATNASEMKPNLFISALLKR
jgi:hypothetical protein